MPEAYTKGWVAYESQMSFTDNPYVVGSKNYTLWNMGYLAAASQN